MRDAVLHEHNQISLFGWRSVNPALIAAMAVSGALLFGALLIRVFVLPKFSLVPGRFQLVLETVVNLLDGLAGVADGKSVKIPFIGAYVFAAGVYIFTGTLFELIGVQAVTTHGASVTLPAPLSDVNAAICMGCLSYLVILCGGAVKRGGKGIAAALKEFSLPISMSFRLFGALLSGLLVTDLVYHYAALCYGIPVVVGVIFTLLHAIVQTYVLTMLVGMYYKEVTEEPEKKPDEFSV
ncbi:MAG: F0F1 ATP synthase subunit A [Oscillibacter sp.]|nr:F0F1 ATP synthase subunit A [Oscillibacter sp.]